MTAAMERRAGAALPPVKVAFEFGNLGHGECEENWKLWKGFRGTRRNPCREGSREWSGRRRAIPGSRGMVWAALKEASRQRRWCCGTSHRSAMAALTPCLGCEPGECGQSRRIWRSQDALVPVPCSGLPSCRGSRGAQDSPPLSSCVLSWLKTRFARKPPARAVLK